MRFGGDELQVIANLFRAGLEVEYWPLPTLNVWHLPLQSRGKGVGVGRRWKWVGDQHSGKHSLM